MKVDSVLKSLVGGLLIVSTTACQHPQSLEDGYGQPETISYVHGPSRVPATPAKYKITGTCNGLPRIDVKTAKGFCVGLVDQGEGMAFPRAVLPLSRDLLLVTDMGAGWGTNVGKLYLLRRSSNVYDRKTLLDGKTLPVEFKKLMDRPHSLVRGPDQKIWIAAAGTIYTLDPLASDILKTVEIKVSGLPSEGLHPLKMMAFDTHHHLYVNMGANTNVCQKFGAPLVDPPQICADAESQGLIRQYTLRADGSVDPQFKVFARGLRNSMALVWDEDKDLLIQSENSRDFIQKADIKLDDANLPAEEINILEEGKNYGWPYCYNKGVASPEFYNSDCGLYQNPYLLLPAHASPLSILIYKGSLFPAWYKNRLILSLHGYREKGHRIVTFKRDDRGLPTGSALSIVYDWEERGEQPMGSPVVLAQAEDGSLFLAEDKNKKILQIYYNPKEGDGSPVAEIDQSPVGALEDSPQVIAERKKNFEQRLSQGNPPLFTQIQAKLINSNCIQCHGGSSFPGIQLKQNDDIENARKLLTPRGEHGPLVVLNKPLASEFFLRISGAAGSRPMPPQGYSSVEEQRALTALVKQWIETGAEIPKP